MPTIRIDAKGPIDMLLAASIKLRPALLKELASVSEYVKGVMKDKVNVGVGGEASGLKGSIGIKIDPANLAAEIKPGLPYGDALETGSRPHWVSAKPGSPLALWAELKGINVYAIQHIIAVRGTKPHPYIQPTYDETAPVVAERFAAGIKLYTEEFSHASL